MVAIKIQRLEDIIAAYLQNLGWTGTVLQSGIEKIAAVLGPEFDGDVLKELDELFYKAAVQVVKDRKLNKEQKLAAFKLAFLLAEGGNRWPPEVFLADKVDPVIKEHLQSYLHDTAPAYKMSAMMPQPIEMPHPAKLLKKCCFSKKAS